MANTVYDFSAITIDGDEKRLSDLKGKVLLIVNTASNCGFTLQYESLQNLYNDYKNDGLEILAFPCNQFGSQEPGDEKEIKSFCENNYKITFPIFSKIEVNGKNEHPLYSFLKESKPGLLGSRDIKWNFTKFLINKNGEVVKRFAPSFSPDKIKPSIKILLYGKDNQEG